MATKRNYSKLDHKIVHALPFVPSRKRRRGYEVSRKWADMQLDVYARETLNYYDLITLLLMVRRYLEQDYEIKGEHDGRKLVSMRFDLATLTKERSLKNVFNNRKTLAKSFLRFKKVDLTFRYNTGEVISSWLVYEVKHDEKSYKYAEVLMNERFLKYCAEVGILVNWKRLAAYGDNGVAVIVDTYLQGVKQKINGKYMYKNWISEETLFKLIDPDLTQQTFELRRQLREAFALMEQHGMPRYIYNSIYKRWERTTDFELEQ